MPRSLSNKATVAADREDGNNMSAAAGRGDRRRRMLNEGRMSATSDQENSQASETRPAGAGRRYAPGPGSVSFGVARQLLPTGGGALAAVIAVGLATGAGLITAHIYQDSLVASLGERVRSLIDVAAPTSLLSWTTTAATLAITAICVIVFGLRRHRSDDLRGVYRWWMPAAVNCLAFSICQTTGLHQVLASAIASQVGWTALPNNAIWWLLPTMLVVAPLAVRVILDLKESRLAASAAIFATVSFGVAIVASLGWTPAAASTYAPAIVAGALHVGLLATLLAQLTYTRRILQEAGGLIAPPEKVKAAAETSVEAKEPAPKSPTAKPAAKTEAEHKPKPQTSRQEPQQPKIATETQWVDGSQGDYGDNYDDEGDGSTRRKLSKAERKRLRKQKARQDRAA